jgi:hypothetical protein
MAKLYRAHRNADMLTSPAEGWCLTNEIEAARAYGRFVAVVEIDDTGLVEVDVDGYDRDNNTTPADSAAFRAALAAAGHDVVVYDDENEKGEYHLTWRLLTTRAVASCRVVRVIDTRDDD